MLSLSSSPPATAEQVSIGNYMRGAWAAFAKDPQEGLTNYGWPVYNTSQDSLVRLGFENKTGPNLINPYRYDADCVFVNVSSTDSNVEIPDLPDLGAAVTPTANGTSPTPTPTATGTGAGAGGASGTTWPSPTSTNAGERLKVGGYLSFVAVMAIALM